MPGSVEVFGNFGSKDQFQILQELTSAKIVGVDTETVSVEDKRLIGLSIAPNPDYAVWFKEDSSYLHIALAILRNPTITKIFHNAKFDYDVLEDYGADETNFEDTMILAYTQSLPLKLYTLALSLGRTIPDKLLSFEFPKGLTMRDIWDQDPNFVLQKCCTDSAATLYCWYKLQSQLTESYAIDRNIVHILRHMEHMGVALNKESVAEFYAELSEQTTYLRQLIQTKGCDPNSNRQVGVALAQLGYRLPYTKSRTQLRVDEKTIMNIDHPLAQSILIYREKNKLLTTYVEPLLGLDRAYTHYNNTRVITGRLSSSDPFNMQNIPDYFRMVFIADTVFGSYDAGQAELRSLAYLAQDKAMMDAFANGRDIHAETMSRMGIVLADKILARRLAKVLNFATAYLGEEETIIENAKKEGIKITPPEATDFRNKYFQTYTGIRDYVYSQREHIIKHGWVKTLYGRVRKADPIRMTSPKSREAVIRELFNMPIQGTAVEVIKKMMARAAKYDLRIQVHDELVYDGAIPPPSLFEGCAPYVQPMDLKIGTSWGRDMKAIK